VKVEAAELRVEVETLQHALDSAHANLECLCVALAAVIESGHTCFCAGQDYKKPCKCHVGIARDALAKIKEKQ
jgi:hypothetical protein